MINNTNNLFYLFTSNNFPTKIDHIMEHQITNVRIVMLCFGMVKDHVLIT
jgi:hypothetical protein